MHGPSGPTLGAFQPRVHQDRCSIRSLIGVTSQELHQQVLGPNWPNAKVARMKSKRVRGEIRLHMTTRTNTQYFTVLHAFILCMDVRKGEMCWDEDMLGLAMPMATGRSPNFLFGTQASENKKQPTVCELRLWPSLHLTALVRCLTIGLHYLSVVWSRNMSLYLVISSNSSTCIYICVCVMYIM